jgi:hypothetical protein
MVKYFINLAINYTHISKIIKHCETTKKYENLILTNDGLIKIENGEYNKYIIKETKESEFIEDDIYADYSYWTKVCTISHIPLEHKFIKTITYNLKMYPKSPITFVIHTKDNKINDYYFETKLEYFEVINEITSFLNHLRNILYI